MRPLRVCRLCGLEAYTEEDLEVFKKDSRSLHGRDSLCKKCLSDRGKLRSRTAEFIEVFRERSPDGLIRCYFCDEVTEVEVIHSLDGDHENWDPDNKVPTHRGCHGRFHHFREKSPNWKGDEASASAKCHRRETEYARPV